MLYVKLMKEVTALIIHLINGSPASGSIMCHTVKNEAERRVEMLCPLNHCRVQEGKPYIC